MDPDEAPQNVGPHMRSKLFDTGMIDQQTRIEAMHFENILNKIN